MARLSKEDEYFLAKDAELREKFRADLEAKAKEAAEHRKIAEEVGVDDEGLARRIRELGFVGETVRVLHLMPLVEVAWADGKLSENERKAICRAAEAHDIEPGTPSAALLASLLEKRPSDTVLEQILEVLKDLLHTRDLQAGTIVDACLDVATASGGILGFGDKVSREERVLIEQIAETFGEEAKTHLAKRLS